MVEVRRNEKETALSLVRRFTRRVQQAGILNIARSKMFRERPKSDLKKKLEALKRIKQEKRMEYLRKLGKIE